jgi:hypothetical protein
MTASATLKSGSFLLPPFLPTAVMKSVEKTIPEDDIDGGKRSRTFLKIKLPGTAVI